MKTLSFRKKRVCHVALYYCLRVTQIKGSLLCTGSFRFAHSVTASACGAVVSTGRVLALLGTCSLTPLGWEFLFSHRAPSFLSVQSQQWSPRVNLPQILFLTCAIHTMMSYCLSCVFMFHSEVST